MRHATPRDSGPAWFWFEIFEFGASRLWERAESERRQSDEDTEQSGGDGEVPGDLGQHPETLGPATAPSTAVTMSQPATVARTVVGTSSAAGLPWAGANALTSSMVVR